MQITDHDIKATHKNIKLHTAIAASGMTQRRIAEQVGIAEKVFSDIKAGRYNVQPHTKRRIAEVLGSTVEELFGGQS